MRSGSPGLLDASTWTRALAATGSVLVAGLTATACTDGAADQAQEPTGAVEAVVVDRHLAGTDGVERRGAINVSRRTAENASVPILHGSMVGSYIVSLYSEDGFWVDVGRGGDVRIPLQDSTGHEQVTVTDRVPAGTYTAVRITMCHSGARLNPGTRIGAQTVAAPTGVKLTETGDVFIRRDVEPFTVKKHRLVRVEIDLNAERWLTAEAVADGRIDVPTFEEAVEVSILASPE